MPNFSSLCWFLFLSAVNSCWQLLTADDSCHKKMNGIFIYPPKLIPVPNFSSLGWFSFPSTVISCHQLLTAFDGWWQLIWKNLTGCFMYTLKLLLVQSFSSLGWFSFFFNLYQLLSAVLSCWQLMTVDMKISWLKFLCTH